MYLTDLTNLKDYIRVPSLMENWGSKYDFTPPFSTVAEKLNILGTILRVP